jgi:lysophospholipase L1-like esterase
MEKITNYIFLILLSVFVFSSCIDEIKEALDTTGDVDIHAFSINGVEGEINNKNSTITVILPAGSALTNLIPQITVADEAVVKPGSGEAIDFLDSNGNLKVVTYTVSNKDLYQKYQVTVDVARAKITRFKIGSVEADIDEVNKKITIYLPVSTDVATLIPVVEFTEGATITPSSGSVVDFTNPVTFTLDYLGSIFTYEVKVILGEKPKPVLMIYDGETVSPIWTSIASTINNGYINPKTDGINTTSNCISILRKKEDTDDGGRPWSGGALWNENKVNIDPSEYGKFTLMVLKNVAGDVQLEIQSNGEQNKDWLKASYSADALGEWQELTFTIPAGRTAIINNILVAPHVVDVIGDPDFSTHMMYWDQLKAIPKANNSSIKPTAVFIGNSITEFWERENPSFFSSNNYLCKGIAGQRTDEMLARFDKDIVAWKPSIAVIMGGINDIAQNKTIEQIRDNIAAMATKAKQNNIKPIICSATPISGIPWNTSITNAPQLVVNLNILLKQYADDNGIEWVDYHTLLKDTENGLAVQYRANGNDLVHFSKSAYDVMGPAIKNAIERLNN